MHAALADVREVSHSSWSSLPVPLTGLLLVIFSFYGPEVVLEEQNQEGERSGADRVAQVKVVGVGQSCMRVGRTKRSRELQLSWNSDFRILSKVEAKKGRKSNTSNTNTFASSDHLTLYPLVSPSASLRHPLSL